MLSSCLVFRQLGEHGSPLEIDLSHIIPHSLQYPLANQPHQSQMFSVSMATMVTSAQLFSLTEGADNNINSCITFFFGFVRQFPQEQLILGKTCCDAGRDAQQATTHKHKTKCWQVWKSMRLLAFNDPVPWLTGGDNVVLSKPRAGRVFNSTRATERMRVCSSFWKYDARLGAWRTLNRATPHKTGQKDRTQHNHSVPVSEENHKVKDWQEGRAAEEDYNLTQRRRQKETE